MKHIFDEYTIFNINPSKLRSKHFFKNMLEYRHKVMAQFKGSLKKPSQFCCPLCKSKKGTELLRYKWYPVYSCKRCGLASPNIDFSKLGGSEIYDDPAYIKDTVREVVASFDYRKKTYAPERLKYIQSRTKLSYKNLKVLDLGCGPGYFVSHLDDLGIKYKGLELAEFLVQLGKKRGLNVENALLEREKPGSWNVVTLFDVLEHLTEPVAMFKSLNRVLMRGGYVVAYTPHIHSLGFFLMGGLQNVLLPFQHLLFFNEQSLEVLCKKSGFRLKHVDYFGLDVMDYLFMKEHQDQLPYLSKLGEALPYIQALVDKAKLANHIRIVFQKI
jgi:2-polyprenyl-3-methyl-5-hydroxy-6-metoxy-1,4-benzoquinol methylase